MQQGVSVVALPAACKPHWGDGQNHRPASTAEHHVQSPGSTLLVEVRAGGRAETNRKTLPSRSFSFRSRRSSTSLYPRRRIVLVVLSNGGLFPMPPPPSPPRIDPCHPQLSCHLPTPHLLSLRGADVLSLPHQKVAITNSTVAPSCTPGPSGFELTVTNLFKAKPETRRGICRGPPSPTPRSQISGFRSDLTGFPGKLCAVGSPKPSSWHLGDAGTSVGTPQDTSRFLPPMCSCSRPVCWQQGLQARPARSAEGSGEGVRSPSCHVWRAGLLWLPCPTPVSAGGRAGFYASCRSEPLRRVGPTEDRPRFCH